VGKRLISAGVQVQVLMGPPEYYGGITMGSIVEVDDVGTFIDLRHVVAFAEHSGWLGLRTVNGEKICVNDEFACNLILEYVREHLLIPRGVS
jgi:hypothetical protein